MKQFRASVFVVIFMLSSVLVTSTSVAENLLEEISNRQAEIYESVAPAVVRIETSRLHPALGERQFEIPKQWEGTPFEYFFGAPERTPKNDEEGQGFMRFGIGSGFLVRVDENGAWILTNNHVLEKAQRIRIEFFDQYPIDDFEVDSETGSPGRNAYRDEKTDLALIHLRPEVLGDRQLQTVQMGDSDQLKIGHKVFTLGAPLDREWTFSQGIVSGVGRGNVFPGKSDMSIRYENLIQTTAFINLGNSGGPLLNAKGEIVGINVAIQTAGGFSNGFIGIGFAIPSNRATRVVEEFISRGEVVRGYLGVQIGVPDQDNAAYFGIPPRTGVEVVNVYKDSPADQGGIEEKDIILLFDGKTVKNPSHLQDLVADTPVESKAKVQVLRQGKRVDLEVPIGPQPTGPIELVAKSANHIPEMGATLRDLDEESIEYFREKGSTEGVLIESVDPTGPLAKSGIKKGTLVTSIEHQKVTSVEEVKNLLAEIVEKNQGTQEVRVMINYIPPGADSETFHIIKLDLSD